MSEEDKKFFESCRELFMCEGWGVFLNEVQNVIDTIDIGSIPSSDEFWRCKGKLEILRLIVNWEASVKAAEAMAEEEQ